MPELTHEQKVLAEEILHKNPGAVVLPPLGEPSEDDMKTENMVPIYHWGHGEGCKQVAFYYTHRPQRGEMMSARRAKYPDGYRPDRNEPMKCGTCQSGVTMRGDLSFSPNYYEATMNS